MNDSNKQGRPRWIWALWDAGDLISLHLDEAEGHDARQAHLESYLAYENHDQPRSEDIVQLEPAVVVASEQA